MLKVFWCSSYPVVSQVVFLAWYQPHTSQVLSAMKASVIPCAYYLNQNAGQCSPPEIDISSSNDRKSEEEIRVWRPKCGRHLAGLHDAFPFAATLLRLCLFTHFRGDE